MNDGKSATTEGFVKHSKSPLSTVTKGIIWEVSVTKDIFPAFS